MVVGRVGLSKTAGPIRNIVYALRLRAQRQYKKSKQYGQQVLRRFREIKREWMSFQQMWYGAGIVGVIRRFSNPVCKPITNHNQSLFLCGEQKKQKEDIQLISSLTSHMVSALSKVFKKLFYGNRVVKINKCYIKRLVPKYPK